MSDLQRAYLQLKDAEARYAYLLGIINRPPQDALGRIARAYAVRLLGVVASEDPEIAYRALPVSLAIARSDGDSIARIMAIAAVIGSKVPRQSRDDPDTVSYFDPDTLPGGDDPFDRGFPDWARGSPEFTALLKDLTSPAFAADLRLAAIRARAFVADDQSVADLGSIVCDAGEPSVLRQFSVVVLYRSSSPQVLPVVSDIAAGRIPGLGEGYQIQALRHLMKSDLIDSGHMSTLQALALDHSKARQTREAAFALAGEFYSQKQHTEGSAALLLAGVTDSNDAVRRGCVKIIQNLGDQAFVAGLEGAKAREQDPLMIDNINAALNTLDPDGGRRPSLHSRLDELERLIDDKGTDQETRRQYEQEYDAVFQQIWRLDKSK